jgi:hypothetical protein
MIRYRRFTLRHRRAKHAGMAIEGFITLADFHRENANLWIQCETRGRINTLMPWGSRRAARRGEAVQ